MATALFAVVLLEEIFQHKLCGRNKSVKNINVKKQEEEEEDEALLELLALPI